MQFHLFGLSLIHILQKTTDRCTHRPGLLRMRDRTGKDLPVKNRCTFCYNTIYNPSPLSLLGQEHLIHRLMCIRDSIVSVHQVPPINVQNAVTFQAVPHLYHR